MEDVDVDVTQDGNVQGKMISDGDYDGKMSPFQLVSRPTMYTFMFGFLFCSSNPDLREIKCSNALPFSCKLLLSWLKMGLKSIQRANFPHFC